MTSPRRTRRQFLKTTAAGAAAVSLSAASYARAAGASDRIRIGLIGCGIRGNYLSKWLKEVGGNIEFIAACDVWKQKREATAANLKKLYGRDQLVVEDYHEVLDNKDVDAVVIATCDHQHCGMLIDAVKAGKDVYIEKPIAMNMEELNAAYDAVKASGRIVQHGTHGRSCRGAASARDFVQSGKLGKLVRVEESRSFYNPYWNGYRGPASEADTNWKLFLYNRPYRPFDSDQHGAWMGYRDFSTGPVGGWMSHFSDLTHFITGADFPLYGICHGGIFAPTSDPRRTAPDTVTAILEYPEGFVTQFTTHFGNGANDYMAYFGTAGTMKTDAPDGWPNGIVPRVSGEGGGGPNQIKEKDYVPLPNETDEEHPANWVRCMRERKEPNANMEAGYRHGVAVLLCDMAMVSGRKMKFDREKRQIVPA